MFLHARRTCFISAPSNSLSFHSRSEIHVENKLAWSAHYPSSPHRPRHLGEIVMSWSRDAFRRTNLLWALAVSHMRSHMLSASLPPPESKCLWSASPRSRRRGVRSHFRLTLMCACGRGRERWRGPISYWDTWPDISMGGCKRDGYFFFFCLTHVCCFKSGHISAAGGWFATMATDAPRLGRLCSVTIVVTPAAHQSQKTIIWQLLEWEKIFF